MKARFSSVEQELGHKIWTIVELFYRAHSEFREQFNSYERKVLNHSRLAGIERENLRLNSAELAGLLDFKSLERLRDGYIHRLKDLCHLVFRGQDRTDLLDRYVSDIFHEISILKEEHYNVKVYAPLYERDAAEVELKHILDEAHTIFPQELRHIRYLFGRALLRLEEHLASFSGIQLFVRSLYLHRNDFVRDAYPHGLNHFYWLMYPLGPLEGYCEVGTSFYHSGFFAEAIEAFRLAERAYREQLAGRLGAAPAEGAGDGQVRAGPLAAREGAREEEGSGPEAARERRRAWHLLRLASSRARRLSRQGMDGRDGAEGGETSPGAAGDLPEEKARLASTGEPAAASSRSAEPSWDAADLSAWSPGQGLGA